MNKNTFFKVWLIYFGIGACGWTSLAGVGFILALAFLSDSSPGAGSYTKMIGQVALVLFVYPLIALAVIAMIIAAVHTSVKKIFGRANLHDQKATAPDISNNVCSENKISKSQTEVHKRRPPIFRVAGWFILAIIGTVIILYNAPGSIKKSGLFPTAVTCLVVFLPLICFPLIRVVMIIKKYRKVERNVVLNTTDPGL